jgi:hypothetical protein
MPVDERARHRLYRKLEPVLGSEEAGTLMELLPAVGFADLATKKDLEILEHRLSAKIEESARRLVMWMSAMVLATGGLAFAAGRFV